VAALQNEFAHLEAIAPTPAHFLHVTIGHDGASPFAGIEPFEIVYRGVNCFNEAVVVEVDGDGPRRLAGRVRSLDLFLPHLTVGYVREPLPAEEVRGALLPVRNLELGTQVVEEVLLCRVPASRATFLRPWTVVQRVRLRR
jgi:2'-5' RNA ligase